MKENKTKLIPSPKSIIFPDIKSELIEMANTYKNLVVSKETLKESKNVRKKLRDERYSIQTIEKQNSTFLSSYVKEFKKNNSSRADELISIIRPTEDIIDEKIKTIEKQLEEEREEKAILQAEHLRVLAVKAQNILDYLDKIIEAKLPDEIKLILEPLMNDDCSEENYEAYALIAQQNKNKVIEQANKIIELLKAKRDAELLKAKEEERLAKAEKEAEAEAERVKKEEEEAMLAQAKAEYFNYFGFEPVSKDKNKIYSSIEDDKKAKEEEEEKLIDAQNTVFTYKNIFFEEPSSDLNTEQLKKLIIDKKQEIKELSEKQKVKIAKIEVNKNAKQPTEFDEIEMIRREIRNSTTRFMDEFKNIDKKSQLPDFIQSHINQLLAIKNMIK